MFPSSWLVPFSRFFPLFLLSNQLRSSVTGGVRGINSCCALVTYELSNKKSFSKSFINSYHRWIIMQGNKGFLLRGRKLVSCKLYELNPGLTAVLWGSTALVPLGRRESRFRIYIAACVADETWRQLRMRIVKLKVEERRGHARLEQSSDQGQ